MAVSAPLETTLKVPRAPLGCPNEKLWLSKNNKTKARPISVLPFETVFINQFYVAKTNVTKEY